MNGILDNYQFNINLSASIYKEDKNLLQSIIYNDGTTYEGTRDSYNKYNKYSANLYFSKTWKNGKNLLFDVTGTKFDTKYRSLYSEQAPDFEVFKSQSSYNTDKYSLLSTLQYQFKIRGELSLLA